MDRWQRIGWRRFLAGAALALVTAGAVVAAVERPNRGSGGAATASGDVDVSRPGSGTAGDGVASPAAASSGGGGALAGPMAPSGAAGGAGAGTADGGAAAVPGPTFAGAAATPRIVRTAALRVRVDRDAFARAADRVASLASGHGGFVAESTSSDEEGERRSATFVLRVPASAFDEARRSLAALGRVEEASLAGRDVTAQLVDQEARIRSLQAQEAALQTLLARARAVGEVLEVQGRLFEVRQQIEQLQAQRSQLGDAADMAAITVTLFERGAALERPRGEPTGLARDVERAGDAAVAVVGGTLVVLGATIPLAAVLGLAWAGYRLAARRRAAAA